jgi:hypothetical protein
MYMMTEYDSGARPCLEYERMCDFLGIPMADEEEEIVDNECLDEVQDYYLRFSGDLEAYDGY